MSAIDTRAALMRALRGQVISIMELRVRWRLGDSLGLEQLRSLLEDTKES
jgi:hypothetical protein